jgi:hypothetical protein
MIPHHPVDFLYRRQELHALLYDFAMSVVH